MGSVVDKRSSKQYKPNFTQRRNSMKKFMFVALALLMALSAFSVQVRPARAAPEILPGPKVQVLVAQLSGPAIDGVVPSGKAEFAASQGSSSLTVGMFNLNLTTGTCLDIAFGRTVFQGVPVINGGASLQLSPSPEEIHLGEAITISIGVPPPDQSSCLFTLSPATNTVSAPAVGTVILSGTFQVVSGTK
jgi:hypothetical protein